MELVRLSVTVTGATPALPPLAGLHHGESQRARTAEVYFDGGGFQPTTVVGRAEVDESSRPGPLIVESMDTTIVVPPDWTARGVGDGLIMLERTDAGEETR